LQCSDGCMENYELLRASLNAYKVKGRGSKYYELIGARSHTSWTTMMKDRYSYTILGHIRLPASERIWDIVFPDHCRGRDVFFAVLETNKVENTRTHRFYKPVIAISCHHYEYGLPQIDEVEKFLTLTKIVGWEAFGPTAELTGNIDLLDDVLEKAVAMLTAENQFNPWGWRTPGQALRQYSRTVRGQLTRPTPVYPPIYWWRYWWRGG